MNPGGSTIFILPWWASQHNKKGEEKRMEKNGKKKEEAKYKFPSGNPIEFYTFELYELFDEPTGTLSGFIDLLTDSENDELANVGRIAEHLLEHVDQQTKKRVEFIEKNLGEISIDIAQGQIGQVAGEFLGLNFTPKTKGEAKD
jgi:hypothetical protein